MRMNQHECPPRAVSRSGTRLLTALLVLALVAGWARTSEAQVGALGGRVTTDVSLNSTTFTNVTGLTWYVAASTSYTFACRLSYTTGGGANDNVLDLSVTGPTTPTAVRYTVTDARSATNVDTWSASAYDTNGTPTGSGGATALPAFIRGTIENGTTAGTFAIRMARINLNNSSAAVTVLQGSFCTVYRQ